MKSFFLLLFACCSMAMSKANNLQISNVVDTMIGGNQFIQFTISWQNSWRTSSAPFNWDAIWIFIKQKDCASEVWRHVNLAPQSNVHSGGSVLTVAAYSDKRGVMLYRGANGFGNINNVVVQLRTDSILPGNYSYQVHGVEMVYIPEGAFLLGDGGSYNTFMQYGSVPPGAPYLITSEAAIPVGADTNKLSYAYNSISGGYFTDSLLLATYPKGHKAFFCMKYEVSQGQYATFLNSITQDAFNYRYPPFVGSYRYMIQGIWPQMQSTTPDRACNFLSFQDLAAYLDWAALSPMTEFEYEKICRGSGNAAVTGEKAWGSIAGINAKTIASGTDGQSTEYVTDTIPPGTGLAVYAFNSLTIEGPLRCGFAARPNSNRYTAGATYYGVMEMSGNVIEQCYNFSLFDVGSDKQGGGLFTGTHGDGELTSAPNAGFANQGWPNANYSSNTPDGYSVAYRGGGWLSDESRLSVSNRYEAYYQYGAFTPNRRYDVGGRGVSRR